MARLGDICKFQSGGTPAKGEPSYFGGGIPWITTVALNGSIINEQNAVDWITEKAIEKSAAKIVPANSIMVGTRVGVGKVAINRVPMSTSQDIISLLDIDESKWSKEFICKFILGKGTYLNSQARGATIKGIKIETLAELQLPNISLERQCEIAAVINNADRLIALRKEQLAKLNQLVKSQFIELFGTPLLNEKGWAVKNAGDVCSVTDGSHFSPVGKEKGYPMLSVKNMRNDGFRYDDCKLVSQEDYDVLVKQGCKPLKNDVLIAKDGSYFYYGFVIKEEIEQAVLSSIAILRPNLEQINPEYLCRYMLSSEIVDLVGKNYVTGAAIKRVILKGIKQIPVMLPPIELQNQFAAFVEQTDKSKLAIQQSLDKLELLKKSLMQEYFG